MKILKSFIESEWEKQTKEAQKHGIDFHVQGAIIAAEYLTVYLRKDENVAFIETDIYDQKHCLIVELENKVEIDSLKQKARIINELQESLYTAQDLQDFGAVGDYIREQAWMQSWLWLIVDEIIETHNLAAHLAPRPHTSRGFLYSPLPLSALFWQPLRFLISWAKG